MIEKQLAIEAFEIIKKAHNTLLVTHAHPDGDALSSICAMIEILEMLGNDYTAFCDNEAPNQFNFIPNIEKIENDRTKISISDFDLIITLDCGNLSRTTLEDEIKNRPVGTKIIEFDHHPKLEDYADFEFKIQKAAATVEVIFDFTRINRIKMDRNLANCILTGILTDTGFFLYPSTTEYSVDIASEMLKYGAKFPQVVENTWRNKSLGAMKIWGKAINNLRINKRYNIAYSVLTYSEIHESGVSIEEIEGIAPFLSNMYGVKAVLLLREEVKGIVRGNLRSNFPNIDISKLAEALGGGGHPKASGFVVNANIIDHGQSWKIVKN